MTFNMRQATWVFAISAALLCAFGFAVGLQAQDDHNRGQDDRHGDQRNGPPAGGYTQSCQDIRANGNTLEARCQARDGNWNQTSLQDFNQCTDSIENNDGRLVCNKGANGNPGYRRGDQPGDRRDNGQNDRPGGQPGDRVDNGQNDRPGYGQGDHRDNGQNDRQGYGQGDRRDNGQDDRSARDRVPDGGYTQTCRDIHTVGDMLQATCQKKNGKWRQASLRNFHQCSSQIENNNGKLVCGR